SEHRRAGEISQARTGLPYQKPKTSSRSRRRRCSSLFPVARWLTPFLLKMNLIVTASYEGNGRDGPLIPTPLPDCDVLTNRPWQFPPRATQPALCSSFPETLSPDRSLRRSQ